MGNNLDNTLSKVFFAGLQEKSSCSERIKALKKVLEASEVDTKIKKLDKVGIKVHVGEAKNNTFVAPEIIKVIVSRVKRKGALPFLMETSTLYKGNRSNAIDHLNQAYSHGFTPKNLGAPFIMADGLTGDIETSVKIDGEIYKSVSVAKGALMADTIILASHPTGHLKTGMGASIKNLGMGLASRKGKLRQHSAIKPYIIQEVCTLCKKCMSFCPEDAITCKDGHARILSLKCIGCGECLAVCAFNAVNYNWGIESEELQKRVAEHALGVVLNKREKLFAINFLFDMTKDCDCWHEAQGKIIPDIGILASSDPVAIDQATLDLTRETFGKNLSRVSYPELDPEIQLTYSEKLGLGTRKYKLISI